MSAQSQDMDQQRGKKRKQNFSAAECALLVDLVEKNLDTLRGQFSTSVTNAKKQEMWKLLPPE